MADFEGNTTFNKKKLTQRINLKELLGREPTPTEKENFVNEALNRIEDRTLDGNDVSGKKFKPYSKEYADKKGVSRNSVDMFLTGGMLESLKPIKETKNTVTFGIEGGDETLRGYNHQIGDTLPQRAWFGINKDEAQNIAELIRDEDQRITLESLAPDEIIDLNDSDAIRRFLDDLLL